MSSGIPESICPSCFSTREIDGDRWRCARCKRTGTVVRLPHVTGYLHDKPLAKQKPGAVPQSGRGGR